MKHGYKTFGRAVFLLAMSISVAAHAETLQEAVQSTLKNNPSLDVATSQYLAAQEERNMSASDYYPEVSVSTTIGRVYQDNATSRGLSVDRGAGYSGYGEGMVALRQNLFDGFETKNRVLAAQARMASYENNITDVEERLVFKAASSYLEVMRTREALDLLKEQRASMMSYHERIVTMVEEGAADETERQQAEDVVLVMNTLVNDYEGDLLKAESDFSEVTGHRPDGHFIRPVSLSAEIPQDIRETVETAVATHPALNAARKETDAAKYDVEAAQAGYLPDLTGELSYLKSDKRDLLGGEAADARAVVHMNWTFETGGRQKSSIERSKAQQRGAMAKVQELQRSLERTIYQAYADHDTIKKKHDLAAKRVEINETLLKSYNLQFESARVNLLQLMRAESQLYKARLDAADTDYQLLTSEYALMASIGSLKNRLLNDTQAQKDISQPEPAEGSEAGEEAQSSAQESAMKQDVGSSVQ
ncbi:MAG: TolC family protein [Alphaproteobacteria bacterium]|nr:TolC family protein [Alphaproteobacteria bacterium]